MRSARTPHELPRRQLICLRNIQRTEEGGRLKRYAVRQSPEQLPSKIVVTSVGHLHFSGSAGTFHSQYSSGVSRLYTRLAVFSTSFRHRSSGRENDFRGIFRKKPGLDVCQYDASIPHETVRKSAILPRDNLFFPAVILPRVIPRGHPRLKAWQANFQSALRGGSIRTQASRESKRQPETAPWLSHAAPQPRRPRPATRPQRTF